MPEKNNNNCTKQDTEDPFSLRWRRGDPVVKTVWVSLLGSPGSGLTGVIVLCSWAAHFSLTLPHFIHV